MHQGKRDGRQTVGGWWRHVVVLDDRHESQEAKDRGGITQAAFFRDSVARVIEVCELGRFAPKVAEAAALEIVLAEWRAAHG